jgi:hypothetical protein
MRHKNNNNYDLVGKSKSTRDLIERGVNIFGLVENKQTFTCSNMCDFQIFEKFIET